MLQKLARLLPPPDQLRENRWLRWLGPALLQPRLWHLSRRRIALGVALGIFFGLLVPLAQMPLSAAGAVVLRANLPAAVASTLVTNPATTAPIYFAAWKLGDALLGEAAVGRPGPSQGRETDAAAARAALKMPPAAGVLAKAGAIGKPLLLGLAVMALACSLAAYLLVSWLWIRRVRWRRRERLDRHDRAPTPAPRGS